MDEGQPDLVFPPLYESHISVSVHTRCVHSVPVFGNGGLSPYFEMNTPRTDFLELREVRVYESLLKDIAVYHERIQCLSDDEGNALCDVCLENVEHAYLENYITSDGVRYLTGKILQGS